MSRNLTEMNKLESYLKEHDIAHERIDEEDTYPEEGRISLKIVMKKHGLEYKPLDRHQIIVYDKEGRRSWDVICQRGSFGAERGLLEGMGDIFKEAEGYLTAEEIIKRIEIQIGREGR